MDSFLAAAAQRALPLAPSSTAGWPDPPPSHLDRVNALKQKLEEQKRLRELKTRECGSAEAAVREPASLREPVADARASRLGAYRAELSERGALKKERSPRATPRELQPQVELSETKLGEGATATVWLAYFGPSRTEVAAKVVSKRGMDKQEIGWIREEIASHKKLRHPNICALHGSFEDLTKFTICLALCRGGSLVDMMGRALDTGALLPDATVHSAFAQLIGAMRHLESMGIVHRDIKLDNLCWVDEHAKVLKLIDFGYASMTDEHTQFTGSAHFAAPEVHRADAEGGLAFSCRAADVWSAGVCLFAMLATRLPFNGGEETAEEKSALRRKICAGEPDEPLPETRSRASIDLASRMLVVDVGGRATLEHVAAHEFTRLRGDIS